MPQEDRFLLRMMHANRFLSSPSLRTQSIRRTGCHLSVSTITGVFLLQDIILAGRHYALD